MALNKQRSDVAKNGDKSVKSGDNGILRNVLSRRYLMASISAVTAASSENVSLSGRNDIHSVIMGAIA